MEAHAAKTWTSRLPRIQSRRRQLGTVALLSALVVGCMIVVGDAARSGSATQSSPPKLALFNGIPQKGYTLGNPDAPVTVTQFIDMQCPFCARFDAQQLPAIVRKYVKPGRVKVELRTLAFLGLDSERGAEAAAAAARQNRLFDFVHVFMSRQGEENSGYVTDEFLRDVASSVPGLSADNVVAGAGGAGVTKAQIDAHIAGVQGTPSFLVGDRLVSSDRVVASIEQQLKNR
jgi:protein-disulfide isomerase